MKIRHLALAATAALAVSACATQEAGQKAESNVLDAKELQAVFKRGGGSCTWTSGATSGEDFYYSTVSKAMGEADRNVGSDLLQGKWSLKDNQLCVDFGTEQCSTLEKAGNKQYKATWGGKVYDLKC